MKLVREDLIHRLDRFRTSSGMSLNSLSMEICNLRMDLPTDKTHRTRWRNEPGIVDEVSRFFFQNY